MTPHQVRLQLRQTIGRDTYVGELAETSVDPIHGVAGGENVLNRCPAGGHAPSGFPSDFHATVVQRNGLDFSKREGLTVQRDKFHKSIVGGAQADIQMHPGPKSPWVAVNRLCYGCMAMDSTALLDICGRKLLAELQGNARLSVAELGRRIGLSPTATSE